MNESLSILLLFSIPGLPLLLAIPVLRSYFPWSTSIALLPVVIILVIEPQLISIEIPWLLLGTTFAIDEMSRILLVMSLIVWSISTAFLNKSTPFLQNRHFVSYFMLTLSGNLGAIIANDLMTFFLFLTLMSYSFYALVVSQNKEHSPYSGRIYLSFMIIADLVLFEALLFAALVTDNLGFSAVHSMIVQSPSADLYLIMILLGFGMKAGLWPLHFWLKRVFFSSQPALKTLLGSVVIVIALLGILRWLPLGEISAPELGVAIQCLGVASILTVIISSLMHRQGQSLAINVIIISSGFYMMALGAGLVDPVLWQQYELWAYYFLASFGIGFAGLVIANEYLALNNDDLFIQESKPSYLGSKFKAYLNLLSHNFNMSKVSKLFSQLNGHLQSLSLGKIIDNGEYLLHRWNIAMILFLLLWLIVVGIAIKCVFQFNWLISCT